MYNFVPVSPLDKFDWPYRAKLEARTKGILSSDNFGHPFSHSQDVWKNALIIYDGESRRINRFIFPPDVDMEIVFAACMLHDCGYSEFDPADPKYVLHPKRSANIAGNILLEVGFPKGKIPDTLDAILLHDDRKPWGTFKEVNKPEIWYVQDADSLEALGPRGVERIIDYDRRTGKPFYVPGISFEDPDSKTKSSLHNIYAHIRLVDHLHTKTARKIGEQKVEYLKKYVEEQMVVYRQAVKSANI